MPGRRCEYCLIPEDLALVHHEVDHVIAGKHGGASDYDNLALCCTLCNRHKGTDLASIDFETGGMFRLFHPRRDRWDEHFEFKGALIVPRTGIGRATVRLLQLNLPANQGARGADPGWLTSRYGSLTFNFTRHVRHQRRA